MAQLVNNSIPDTTIAGGSTASLVSGIGQQGTLVNNPSQGTVISPARIAVPYRERYPRSYKGEFRDNGSTIEREYQVPWETSNFTWYDAVKDLLGYPYVVRVGNTGYISRYLPDAIWALCTDEGGFEAGSPFLWCTSVRLEGADVPPDRQCFDAAYMARYNTGFLTATYETLTYGLLQDQQMPTDPNTGLPDEASWARYCTVEAGAGQKYQTLSRGSFVLVDGAPKVTPYPGTPGKTEVECDLSVTWHQVPTAALPFRLLNPYMTRDFNYTDAVTACLGTVNVYDTPIARKGTILLTSAAFKRIRSAIGMRLWDVTYKWKYFPAGTANPNSAAAYGHNLVLYANNSIPGYYEIVAQGANSGASNYFLTSPADGVNLFNYRDHSFLFRCPQFA